MTSSEVVERYTQRQILILTWEQHAQRQAHYQRVQLDQVEVEILGIEPSPYGGTWLECQLRSGGSSLKMGSCMDLLRVGPLEGGPHLRGIVVRKKQEGLTLHVGRAGLLVSGDKIKLKACFIDTTPQLVRILESLPEHKTLLRDVLLNLKPSEKSSDFPDKDLLCFNGSLNDSQRRAVLCALNSRTLSIIHGPPGTGKTTVLLEIIQQYRARWPLSRVLVASGTNLVVDNLSHLLNDASVSICRLGNPARVSPALRQVLVDTSTRTGLGLKVQISKEAGVTAATVHGCMGRIMAAMSSSDPYGLVVVDEAAQLIESHTWAAITRGLHLVLAGDHMQLPPVVMSRRGKRELSRSLMERLVDEGHSSVLLTTQHRSNSTISSWISKEFYSSQVESAPEIRDATLAHLPGVRSCAFTRTAMVLVDTQRSGETKSRTSESSMNEGECRLVNQVVRKLSHMGVKDNVVGIISPYSAQVGLIRESLPIESQVVVSTVDGFQGMEKEVVIFSAVRCNIHGRIGFLNDSRRLNVAVSRAKRQFVLVCDTATLGKNTTFGSLINYIKQKGLVLNMRGMNVDVD